MRLSAEQRDEITDIRNRNEGRISPADVVDFARNPNTALHAAFMWDNVRAATEHRLDQARRLIAVYVTVIRHQGRNIRVRPLISNPSIRHEHNIRSGYVDVSMVRGNARLELSVMIDVLRLTKGMLTRFGAFPNMRRLILQFIEMAETEKMRMETAITAGHRREQQRANDRPGA